MIPSFRLPFDIPGNLVWLASYPKSGNTWFRSVLHAYLGGTGVIDINKFGQIGGYGDVAKPLYQRIVKKPSKEETVFLRSAALLRLSRFPGDHLVKTHSCNGFVCGVEQIPRELTKCAFYIIRDPRDVAISYAHHTGISIDQAIQFMSHHGALLTKENRFHHLDTWSQHVRSWHAASQGQPRYGVLFIRYEDMLARPMDIFRQVVNDLTHSVDEDLLARSVEACRFDNLRAQEEQNGFRERTEHQDRFFRAGRSTWREVLTPEQIERIERDHGEVMEAFGYEVSDLLRRRNDLRREGAGRRVQGADDERAGHCAGSTAH